MRPLRTVFVMLCACGLTLPVASAPPTNTPNAEADQAKASEAFMRALQESRSCVRGCHDCWYYYFPGAVNYCLGMRDWKNGSYRSGLEYLELAAGWGNKNAQYTLGLIYYRGRHVAADRARGLAWLMLANERHNDAQTELAARLAIRLATAEQYQRAQQLLQEMRKRYGDKVAGARAWRHVRNRVNSDTSNIMMPKTSCVLESGDVVPWSHGASTDPHMLCMPSGQFSKNVARIAGKYFKGLRGTVTVGPLQQAPASSSTR